MNTSVQLQSKNAQTPWKTVEYHRPESKTNQQNRGPRKICKTSIPGSNPGGASKFPNEIAGFCRPHLSHVLLRGRASWEPPSVTCCARMCCASQVVKGVWRTAPQPARA